MMGNEADILYRSRIPFLEGPPLITRISIWAVVLGICLLMGLSGCMKQKNTTDGNFDIAELDQIVSKILPGESVAVSWICEAGTDNITALGNLWRDRVEKAFSDRGISVKGRRDLCLVLEDMASFGSGGDEETILKNAGAAIVVIGKHRVIEEINQPPQIKLIVKALRGETAQLVGTAEWTAPLASDWRKLASQCQGNAYQKKIDTITAPESETGKPFLTAWLDRPGAVYAEGETGEIHIESEPGVYLYLLNLTADGIVALLYPNRLCPAKVLSGKIFVFPPPDCRENIELEFHPLEPGGVNRESVKVVASRTPLDFSFLPEPINQPVPIAQGGDIKKVYDVLDQAKSWNEVLLEYTVDGTE